jgi:hypothetical protein
VGDDSWVKAKKTEKGKAAMSKLKARVTTTIDYGEYNIGVKVKDTIREVEYLSIGYQTKTAEITPPPFFYSSTITIAKVIKYAI